ncbi:MAG: ATP-dependent ligase, partial [Brevundimonas sp.]|nr:ATP-dependent ligase [Brevundimonas sp.]
RIRWDKPAREANTLNDVMDMLDAIESGGGRLAKDVTKAAVQIE